MPMQWEGRDVVFADFSIRDGRVVRAAFGKDSESGSYACLVASARYADTGEPVFRSVDEVEDMPFRLQQRILRLAAEAAKSNGLLDDDAAERATNGSGEAAERPGPSH